MTLVAGVRFKKAGKIYYFDPGELQVVENQKVVVETARGLELGTVVVPPKEVPEDQVVTLLKPIARIAGDEDLRQEAENKSKEKEAFTMALRKIEEHRLPMKLVDVEYTFDHSKIIFYFTAEGRVDFRNLVRDLASIFRTRIELRQIGVRDEAKMLGGLGSCGRILCCSSFLGDFDPVSIRMAKDQNLSLNPNKISGICGRLMCCLRYENDHYRETRQKLPMEGEEVQTPQGEGSVVKVDVLKELVGVKLKHSEEEKTFDLSQVLRRGMDSENHRPGN